MGNAEYMGILHLTLVEEGSKMKFITAACLIAATFAEPEANAEADAALLYGAYGYGGHASPYALGYRGYAGAYGAYPYATAYGAHYIGKRSAEAEPEADADAFYVAYGYSAYGASPYAYSGYRGYSGYRAHSGYPYSYGAYPAYGAYSQYG